MLSNFARGLICFSKSTTRTQIIVKGLHEAGMRGRAKRFLKFHLNLTRVQQYFSQVVDLRC